MTNAYHCIRSDKVARKTYSGKPVFKHFTCTFPWAVYAQYTKVHNLDSMMHVKPLHLTPSKATGFWELTYLLRFISDLQSPRREML